ANVSILAPRPERPRIVKSPSFPRFRGPYNGLDRLGGVCTAGAGPGLQRLSAGPARSPRKRGKHLENKAFAHFPLFSRNVLKSPELHARGSNSSRRPLCAAGVRARGVYG